VVSVSPLALAVSSQQLVNKDLMYYFPGPSYNIWWSTSSRLCLLTAMVRHVALVNGHPWLQHFVNGLISMNATHQLTKFGSAYGYTLPNSVSDVSEYPENENTYPASLQQSHWNLIWLWKSINESETLTGNVS
jgi:hypothetical protein